MKVWIDQDLCTGDGLCEEIAPAVFTLLDDGLAYVKEGDKVFSDPGGAEASPTCPGHGRGRHRVRRGVPRRVHLHRGRLTDRARRLLLVLGPGFGPGRCAPRAGRAESPRSTVSR